MKIIQLNAWLGRLNGPLARFVAEQQADILCLQEAYKPNQDMLPALADQYNFLEEVRRAGAYTYESFAENWAMELSGATIIEGNVVLSRYPLTNERKQHIHGGYHVRRTKNDAIANTRVWQSCDVTLPGGKTLTVANYQGYLSGNNPFGDETSRTTIQRVTEIVASLPKPLIVCGDFNLVPASDAIKLLEISGLTNHTAIHNIQTTLSPVHRAPLPDRDAVACDYIYTSDGVQVTHFEVSEAIVSDHKALILEFEV